MSRLLPLTILFGLALLVPLGASAEEPQSSRFFDVYDKDGDGSVSLQELGGDQEVFRLLDKDGDGAITPADLGGPANATPKRRGAGAGAGAGGGAGAEGKRPGRPGGAGGAARMKERLLKMDANGDGAVDSTEFKGGPEQFSRLDQNGNGAIEGSELDAPPQGRGGQGRGGQGRGGQGRGGQGRERPSPEQMREALRKMDANGDGRITKDEYTGPIPFERLDRDGDGALTEKDRRQGRGQQVDVAKRFRHLDANGDGTLTEDELKRPGALEHLDKNGDGAVSLEEFTKALEGRARQGRPGAGEGARRGPPTTTPGETQGGAPAKALPLADLDKDGNGKLSRNEFPGPDGAWRAHDRNRDGWITADEASSK